jgi:hypothetical protein
MFNFSLSKELGYKHPDYLIADLSCKQLVEWQVFYKHRPFGDDLGFYQAGIIACMIANVNLKKGKKPFTPNDFIPNFSKKPEDSWEKIKKQLSAMATKKVKRKKKNGKHRKHNSGY